MKYPAPEARTNENLQRLLAELESYATAEPRCQSRRAAPDPAAQHIAARLPLAHLLGEAAFLAVVRNGRLVCQRALVARGDLPPKPDNSEVQLGTDGHVFTFVAPFRYPATMAGFLFGPQLEHGLGKRAAATPFDSGGLFEHFERPDPAEPARDFLSRHELPVPGYRDLPGNVLAWSIAQPWHYVEAGALDGPRRRVARALIRCRCPPLYV